MSGALVLQRGPLTQQPQQAVPVDWSNPITRGLYGLFSPGPGSSGAIVDAASGAIWTPDSPFPFSYGKNGRGALTNGASKRYYATLPQYPGTVNGGSNYAPGAVVLVARVNATSGTEVFVNNVGAWLGISGGQWSYNGGGNSANTTAALGRDQVVIFNVNLSNVGTIYVDGVASTATFAPNGFIAANPVSLLEYGTGGFSPANSALYQFAIFNRELTQAEVKSLTANPWQLFQAPRRRLWLAVNNSGTNGTATPAGVSAASAIGSVIATGAATATPSGVFSASAVGSPAATGDANTTPSGVSATSAVGSPSASAGTNATASPAGVSAASAVGSPVATGGASAVPAGVASASAVGSPTVAGSATATPSGVAAASAVSNVVASGPMDGNAYPQGVQATTAVGVPTFGKTDTADGVSRGGNTKWRGWDEKAWRKRHVRDEIAADVRAAWRGLKEAPQPVKEELPAPVKPIVQAKRIEPQQLDLSEVKALMAAWEAEQRRREDEEEEDLIALLQL